MTRPYGRVVTFATILVLIGVPTGIAEITGDTQILAVVADRYERNLAKIKTWQGEAIVTRSVTSGSGSDQMHRQGKYKAEFLVDRTAKAVRYSWYTLEEVERKGGEEVRSDMNPIAGMTTDDCDYVMSYLGYYGRPGTMRNLNIYPRDTRPRYFQGAGFDPVHILEQEIYPDLCGQLRFYAKIGDSKTLSPGTVVRQGDLVTLETTHEMEMGTHVEKFVFDLSKDGSLLEYYNYTPGNNKTLWTLTYEDVNGIFIPKTVSLSDSQPKSSTISQHHAVLTNRAVNKPIGREEFSLHVLGLMVGDQIKDTRTGLTYKFGEAGATEADMPLKLSRSLVGKPLLDLKGLGLTPADANDKPLLVCFIDVEQRPSRNTVVQLAKQAEPLQQKGLVIVAVQASPMDEAALKAWAKENNVPFPIGMVGADEEKTRFAWGVKALPWLTLTDKDHIVRAEGFALDELGRKIEEVQGTAK